MIGVSSHDVHGCTMAVASSHSLNVLRSTRADNPLLDKKTAEHKSSALLTLPLALQRRHVCMNVASVL